MKRPFTFILSSFIISLSFSCFAQQGEWQKLATRNDIAGRSECGMAEVDGKFYLIGGGEGIEPVQQFDPQTQQWVQKAEAPVMMHHFQAVGFNGKVYVLAAFGDNNYPNQVPLANVQIYNTKTDRWDTGAGLPAGRRRAGAGAAAYRGKLYLIDGIQHGHNSGTNSMFDEYDPVTNTWKTLPDAPHIRDHCTAAVIGDKLYAVGGRNTSLHDPNNFMSFFDKTVLEVDCYDFTTGKWMTLAAKLPLGSGGGALVNLRNTLYYMGGERATKKTPNGPKKSTYFLDPSAATEWTETDSLNIGRNGTAAVVYNDKIYLAGGAAGQGGPPPPPPNAQVNNQPGMQMPNQPPQPGQPNQPNLPQIMPSAPGGLRAGAPGGPSPGMRPVSGSISLEVFTLK